MAVVHLTFEAQPRPAAFLESCMEVNPRVGARIGHYVNAKIEVLETVSINVPVVKYMGRIVICLGTFHHDHSVMHLEDVRVVADFPAIECSPVKEAHKTVSGGRCLS